MENQNFSIFKTIFGYSVFILASPIITFFVSKVFFESVLGTSNLTGSVWSAVLAIVMLHIAVGLYIYKAYYEADKVKPEDKID